MPMTTVERRQWGSLTCDGDVTLNGDNDYIMAMTADDGW